MQKQISMASFGCYGVQSPQTMSKQGPATVNAMQRRPIKRNPARVQGRLKPSSDVTALSKTTSVARGRISAISVLAPPRIPTFGELGPVASAPTKKETGGYLYLELASSSIPACTRTSSMRPLTHGALYTPNPHLNASFYITHTHIHKHNASRHATPSQHLPPLTDTIQDPDRPDHSLTAANPRAHAHDAQPPVARPQTPSS
ncbi:hypothetical protein EDC01DRAFT_441398 [Geopyxis carbonaria]|nr:hypothetical protein EDC01DRAFT_441398 [Geopyxis carbonaria]